MLTIKNLKKLLIIAKDLKKQLLLATLFGSFGHLSVVVITFLLTSIFLKEGWIVGLLIIATIAFAFLKGFFSYTEQLLNHYVAFKILHVLRLKVLDKFKKLSMNNFSKNSSGDYMTMIMTDIEILEVFYAHTITPFLIYVIQTLAVTLFIAMFNVKLSLIVFVLYVIIGFFVPIFSKTKGELYGNDYRNNLTNINNSSVEEAYSIFETIQYNKVHAVKEKLKLETELLTTSSYKKAQFQININFLTTVLYNLSIIIFIIFATKLITDVNTIITLTALYIVSFTPVLYMGNLASTLSQTMAAGTRFINLLEMEESTEQGNKKVEFNELKINNLSFKYNDNVVVDNISFTARKGEIIGICGESGSGKSTLAKLIMQFLPVEDGEILIDNINIKNIDTQYFRENSSIIMQESYLFNSSLESNVTIFDKNINKEKLLESFDNTNLTNFVSSLKKGTREIIGERSSNVSSGQKQRIATSRSLYNNSKLLILDEATSNIDIFSEIELLKTLEQIKENKIILIISHNKSTLSICDKIVQL